MAPKNWYLSNAVRGGLASILGGVVVLLGVDIDVEKTLDAVLLVGNTVLTIGGGFMALYGRTKADRGIRWKT